MPRGEKHQSSCWSPEGCSSDFWLQTSLPQNHRLHCLSGRVLGPSIPEDDDHLGEEPIQEEDEGLYIPSFLEEALGGYCNLQIKMAHTMQAQEKCDRKCFICQSGDHLMKDHYKGKNRMGPLQLKGPLQNKSARETAKASPPSRAISQGAPPK